MNWLRLFGTVVLCGEALALALYAVGGHPPRWGLALGAVNVLGGLLILRMAERWASA